MTSETMTRRVQYHRYGGPEEMRLETASLAAPKRGEVLVRVRAASVNEIDWKLRQGYMKFITGSKFPIGMGMDFSGIVEGVGPGVTRFSVGDEVLGTCTLKAPGSFGAMVVTLEKQVVKKPASLSFEEAATLPVAGVTAWCALVVKGQVKSGQRVFINAAYGAVGQAAVHIARAFGATVAGRVGARAIEDAKAIGVDPALDYAAPLPAALHGQFDIVFDAHGSLTPKEGDALAGGRGMVLDIVPTTAKFLRSVFSSRRAIVFGTQSQEVLQKVVDLAADGKLRISIGRRVSLDEAIPLITDLEAGRRTKGKPIIVMA